jgi:chromosome segregation ATPase
MNPLIDRLMAGMESMPAPELERIRRALERGIAAAASTGPARRTLSPAEQELADVRELLETRQAETQAVSLRRSALQSELYQCEWRLTQLQQRRQRLQTQIAALEDRHAECQRHVGNVEARIAQLEAGQ